jgi:S-adenosylmethionine:tRNA ribosyltransferase-isomerase
VKRRDLEYDLPGELIAQQPATARTLARLLYLPAAGGRVHHSVADLPSLLRPGDLLVLNDSRVIPARLHAHRATGGRVRMLFLGLGPDGEARALLKARGRLAPGETLVIQPGEAEIVLGPRLGGGLWVVRVRMGTWKDVLIAGLPPLPPYIRRPFSDDANLSEDRERYQTVFARHDGSVAAPTAGLHFDQPLLLEIKNRGIETAFVTLHVGPGTFRPVQTENLDDHVMEKEWCHIPWAAAEAVTRARAENRRVVAVGTTVVRTLESAAQRATLAGSFETRLFIRPPFRFALVDALITNFHLPGSTLLSLVAAFAGLERVMEAYRHAATHGYRFYSYGDAMLIEPNDA